MNRKIQSRTYLPEDKQNSYTYISKQVNVDGPYRCSAPFHNTAGQRIVAAVDGLTLQSEEPTNRLQDLERNLWQLDLVT